MSDTDLVEVYLSRFDIELLRSNGFYAQDIFTLPTVFDNNIKMHHILVHRWIRDAVKTFIANQGYAGMDIIDYLLRLQKHGR